MMFRLRSLVSAHRTRQALVRAALMLGALSLAGCASTVAVDPTSDTAPAVASAPTAQSTTRGPAVRLPSNVPLRDIPVAATQAPSVATLAAPADLWERIRRGLSMRDLDNELVRSQEQWYASRPDYIQRMTERSRRYLFHIVEEIERRNLPMELALLPFIESAFNPQAVSSARAAGMWQFMPATGASFDLKQNAFRDDRRDVLASTRAALDYLEQLHARFGDWHLALAAYNWGQGNVGRALTRAQRQGQSTAYEDLPMPAETRQYVPKLQAVKNIIAQPERFGARLPEIGNHPFFDTITLDRDMDVALIARLADVQEDDFRALNPSLKQPVVMAAATPNVLLPWDNAKLFAQRLPSYDGPLASWTAWVVPQTMSVADAAKRVGSSESVLRQVNNIPPRVRLRAGSSLLVPRSAKLDQDVPAHVADNARLQLQPEVVLRRTVVKARKGENVAKLARRYGVSPVSVAEWNKLSVSTALKPGQRITLLLPRQATTATAKKPNAQKKTVVVKKKNTTNTRVAATAAKQAPSN